MTHSNHDDPKHSDSKHEHAHEEQNDHPSDLTVQDRLAPTSSIEDAMISPLSLLTISSNQLSEIIRFYVDGLHLVLDGPLELSESSLIQKHYGINETSTYQIYHLHRPGVEGSIPIQVFIWDQPQPHIHQNWGALELGSFSIGFPNLDQSALDQKMRTQGFGGLNEIEIYQLQSPNGMPYTIKETIFKAPDYIHAVGIERCDGMPPLGAVDPHTGLGGPAYSSQIIRNTDDTLRFYRELLGLELRASWEWESAGTDGALNIPDGTVFKFSLVYAPGATSGHLLFVEYMNQEVIEPLHPPRFPHVGIGMWSFQVKDLSAIMTKVQQQNWNVLHGQTSYIHPILGSITSITLIDPNHFLIELYQPTLCT